jgi:beta-N-acetylhexosaminidase
MQHGRLMLDVAGFTLTDSEREILACEQVGGLIIFARNYQSKQQLSDLIADIRQQSANIVIAVDQEGGRVQRFREEFVSLPPMFALHLSYQIDQSTALKQAREMGWLMACEVTSMDIDISFAPVLDLHWAHSCVIGTRSFGASHQQVSALTRQFIKGMKEAGMSSTGKHFPGHGWASADSHIESAIDERSFELIEKDDLQPFKQLIAAGLDAVMPAHVVYSKIDTQPAGFSKYWLQNVLRRQLQFDGVIFSDDLNMNGAHIPDSNEYSQYAGRAVAALKAGCDIALVCNNPKGALEVREYLDKNDLAKSDRLSRMRLTPVKADLARFDNAKQTAKQLNLLMQ